MTVSRRSPLSVRRPRLVLTAWLVVLVGGLSAGPGLFDRLSSEVGSIDGSESSAAADRLWTASPSGEELYAVVDGRAAGDPVLRSSVTDVTASLRGLPGVRSVDDPWSTGAPEMVATDGGAVAIAVELAPSGVPPGTVDEVERQLRAIDAPRVLVGGGLLQDDEMDAQAAEDLARAELLSMPVVLVLLLVIFGGVLAAGLPIVVAFVSVAGTLLALLGVSRVVDVSVYSVNIVTMLGLGLAVDYALLLVSRFREERAVHPDVRGAVERSLATAGRTVAFSGLTVAVSLAALLVFEDDFLRSMGFAGMAVVLLDLVAALTLVPALLVLVGHRIRVARPQRDSGRFAALARRVRPCAGLVAIAVAGVLLLAGAPFLGARYADPGASSLPAGSESRRLAELVSARFAAGTDVDPLTVVAQGAVDERRLAAYVNDLRGLDGVRRVEVRQGVRGLTVVDVHPEGESQGPVALRLVREVRELPAPAAVQVTGDAAALADYSASIADRLPWALALLMVTMFVLLFAFTGSVVLPAKALLMNTLSLGASFGALVWVFQDGHLGGLVGTQALGSLSTTTPVLVFAIAFGLSMDYEIFLLSRIQEAYRETGSNDLAVELGLQRSGRVVTSAALLVVVVFLGFVAGGFSPVKQVGLGLVLAVAVDATLVRMLLVPATMQLLGRWNWWAPAPLARLHRRFGLQEERTAVRPSVVPA